MRLSVVPLATLALAVALTACSPADADDDETVAGELDVLPATYGIEALGLEQRVLVPDGGVTIAVTDPQGRLDFTEVETEGIGDVVPPDGYELVGVEWTGDGAPWSLDEQEIMTGQSVTLAEDPDRPPASITVEVTPLGDDEPLPDRLDLGATTLGDLGDDGRVWVVVPEDSTLTAVITYDGQEQTVPLAYRDANDPTVGAASGLADLVERDSTIAGTSAECPVEERPERGFELGFFCGVRQVWATPYVDGLGWAADGQTWLVADVDAEIGREPWWLPGDDTFVTYDATLVDWQAGLDGVAPRTRLTSEYAPEGPTSQRLVWSVPTDTVERPHRLRLDATYDLTKKGRKPFGPDRATRSVRRLVTVSAAPHA